MAAPSCRLEEQLSDLRSDQIAYKLTIENQSAVPIRLLAVAPRIPVGARLLEITDTSLAEANARKAALLDELNHLLQQYLWVTSAPFRQTWIDRRKEAYKEIFSFSGIVQVYYQMLTNPAALDSRLKREFESITFKISSSSDAQNAYTRWMESSTEHEAMKSLFQAKTNQLESVEMRMDENDRFGLTAIESGSYFTATYVMKFSRRLFEPKKYQVAFEATYSLPSVSSPQNISTATNVQISPLPWSLSAVAILASVMGVLLRVSLSGNPNPLEQMFLFASNGQLLVGPIVALIFFNVYEHTSLGKNITMAISWRSALLVGALCGLAQDRILAALKALIGA